MKHLQSSLVLFLALISTPLPMAADPDPAAPGHGHAAAAEDFRGIIHALFADHDKVKRVLERTEIGYRAVTTSPDPGVASRLQTHVAQMKERLDGGLSVRHWDPAFVEFRDHYDDLEIAVTNVTDGVSVEVTGSTPEAIEVAWNHGAIVSGFVEHGGAQMHETHPAVVESGRVARVEAETVERDGEKSCAAGGGGCAGEGCAKGGAKGEEGCGTGEKPCCADGKAKETVEPADGEVEKVESAGRAAAGVLMQSLGAQLEAAMKAGGPVAGIEICRNVAIPLTEGVAGSFEGVKVRRTSLKTRNPANAPDALDREVLEHLALAEALPEGVIEWTAEVARHYTPIVMKEACVKCHGDRDGFPVDLRNRLEALYPEDEATGYAVGDLRGVIRVDVPR